jgi:hypothetical protein
VVKIYRSRRTSLSAAVPTSVEVASVDVVTSGQPLGLQPAR